MATRARALYEELRRHHVVEHDEGGQIGRRLPSPGRNRDAVGIHRRRTDTRGRNRHRARPDSLAQERLSISGVRAWLDDALERDWSSPQSD